MRQIIKFIMQISWVIDFFCSFVVYFIPSLRQGSNIFLRIYISSFLIYLAPKTKIFFKCQSYYSHEQKKNNSYLTEKRHITLIVICLKSYFTLVCARFYFFTSYLKTTIAILVQLSCCSRPSYRPKTNFYYFIKFLNTNQFNQLS